MEVSPYWYLHHCQLHYHVLMMPSWWVSFVDFTTCKALDSRLWRHQKNTEFVEPTKDRWIGEAGSGAWYVHHGLKKYAKNPLKFLKPSKTGKPEALSNSDVLESMKTRELDHLVFASPLSGQHRCWIIWPQQGSIWAPTRSPKGYSGEIRLWKALCWCRMVRRIWQCWSYNIKKHCVGLQTIQPT